MSSLRHLPPTAVPIRVRDLYHGLGALRHPEAALELFASAVQGQTGSATCLLLSSGRAALTVILLGLKRLSHRTRVVVPAYSCPTVVQSVLEAGLDPVLCDVSPRTLDFDAAALSQLIGSNLLAVIPVHLYGLAQDVRYLLEAGKEYGFFVVEDAAQAYGATFQGRMVGTRGHAGLYSLGRGKVLPAGHGGVIVAKEEVASAIGRAFSEVQAGHTHRHKRRDVGALARLLAYGLATHPAGWWFVARSPLNPAGEGMDATTLPPIRIRGLSAVRAAIASSFLERLDQDRAIRLRHAQQLTAQLDGCGSVLLPAALADGGSVFLRFPMIVDSSERAARLFDQLHRAGIGASRSYRRALSDLFAGAIDTMGHYPGAERLAKCLITLPTHAYLKEGDVERMAGLVWAAGRGLAQS